MSRVLVFLFTVVLRRKLQSTTCLLVVPKPTYVLLCRVGNCLATCFCLFIWFSDFFLFHICRALSFSLPQGDTCWDKLRVEAQIWECHVTLQSEFGVVLISIWKASHLYNKHFACLNTSTHGTSSHFEASKSASSWPTNQASRALEGVGEGVRCRGIQSSDGLRFIKRINQGLKSKDWIVKVEQLALNAEKNNWKSWKIINKLTWMRATGATDREMFEQMKNTNNLKGIWDEQSN